MRKYNEVHTHKKNCHWCWLIDRWIDSIRRAASLWSEDIQLKNSLLPYQKLCGCPWARHLTPPQLFNGQKVEDCCCLPLLQGEWVVAWLYEFEATLLKKCRHTWLLPSSPMIIKFRNKSMHTIKIMHFHLSFTSFTKTKMLTYLVWRIHTVVISVHKQHVSMMDIWSKIWEVSAMWDDMCPQWRWKSSVWRNVVIAPRFATLQWTFRHMRTHTKTLVWDKFTLTQAATLLFISWNTRTHAV